jgi:predicted RNase H-like HicB family nuclease
MKTRLTAVISKEGNDYVALNPDLDIASQGPTPESALINLREAVDLFFETAPAGEIRSRLGGETWITQFEAEYAQA